MVSGHEVPGRRQGDVAQFELIVQQQTAALVIGEATKLSANKRLDSCASEKFARPSRIVVHVVDHGLMERFATRPKNELVTPDFHDLEPLGLAAEQAGRVIGKSVERVAAVPAERRTPLPCLAHRRPADARGTMLSRSDKNPGAASTR